MTTGNLDPGVVVAGLTTLIVKPDVFFLEFCKSGALLLLTIFAIGEDRIDPSVNDKIDGF